MDNFNVEVVLSSRNMPATFKWLGRMYRVSEVQEYWRLVGAWWDGEGEQTYFRVATDKGGIYNLRFDHRRSEWAMAVVED